MTPDRQICKCGNHEIEPGAENTIFGGCEGHLSVDNLIDAKIILNNYRFNVHYQIYRDEWHFQQFDNLIDVIGFCRDDLKLNQIYKIFHQISACVDGRAETIARHITLRDCKQMINDENVYQQNNIETAYKLILKLCAAGGSANWNNPAKNRIEA